MDRVSVDHARCVGQTAGDRAGPAGTGMVGVVSRPLRRRWSNSGDRYGFLDRTSLLGVPRGRGTTRKDHGAVALAGSGPPPLPPCRGPPKRKGELMTRKLPMTGLLVALSAVALVGRAMETSAADFTVNSTVDAVDANPGDGACATLG